MIISTTAALLLLGSGSVSTALNHLNGARRELGLSELRLNATLSKAAEGHAKYLALNKAMSHEQVSGKPGFTGRTALDRAKAAGFKSEKVLEDLAYGDHSEALAALFGGPYHRRPLLQPAITEVGIGFQSPYTVYLFEVQTSTDPLLYPQPNQTVASSWNGLDVPSPYRMHKAKPPFGTPVQIYLRGVGRFTLEKFVLDKVGSGQVQCLLNSATNDPFLSDGAMLIPLQPLAPKSEFRARFSATSQLGKRIEQEWTFKTK